MRTEACSTEYQDSMRKAALAFLLRHQSEHLTHDSQLLERTVTHLVNALEVNALLARKLAELAYSELDAVHDRQRLSSTQHHTPFS